MEKNEMIDKNLKKIIKATKLHQDLWIKKENIEHKLGIDRLKLESSYLFSVIEHSKNSKWLEKNCKNDWRYQGFEYNYWEFTIEELKEKRAQLKKKIEKSNSYIPKEINRIDELGFEISIRKYIDQYLNGQEFSPEELKAIYSIRLMMDYDDRYTSYFSEEDNEFFKHKYDSYKRVLDSLEPWELEIIKKVFELTRSIEEQMIEQAKKSHV